MIQSYVTSSSSLQYCPSPSCPSITECSVTQSDLEIVVPTVACCEGHTFCYGCGMLEDHTPVICKIAKRWRESEDSGSAQWIKVISMLFVRWLTFIYKLGEYTSVSEVQKQHRKSRGLQVRSLIMSRIL